jgi:site-specific DNA-methyltransferase (adenine-specific)
MRYLVRLVTPPDGLVFDPFMGSGSTGLACLQEAFRFVGIEFDPHNLTIARHRLARAKRASNPEPIVSR